MTEVVIRNKDLLEELDSFVDWFYSIPGSTDEKFHMFDPGDARERGEYYTSDEYLRVVQSDYNAHSGFPEQHFSQPIGQMAMKDPENFFDISMRVRKEFPATIGAHSSALFNFYPPGGFVGWHTNWNANAYQILFTWSQNGDGYFKYLDNETGKIVTIEDKPGWQCRWYYFGLKDEPNDHCWHAAYTRCDRFTLAYKFFNGHKGKDDVALDEKARLMRDNLVEEIENE